MEDSNFANSNFSCLSIIDADFFSIIDADVSGLGKLACAEEQGAAEQWDHVDCACRVPEGVLEKAHVRRWQWVAVW